MFINNCIYSLVNNFPKPPLIILEKPELFCGIWLKFFFRRNFMNEQIFGRNVFKHDFSKILKGLK